MPDALGSRILLFASSVIPPSHRQRSIVQVHLLTEAKTKKIYAPFQLNKESVFNNRSIDA